MNEARLRSNWEGVRQRVADAASKAGHDLRSVRLVVVTKRSTADVVRALVTTCGAADLGENYPQELWRKAEALHGLSVRWHLIGHLQSNKARRTLPLVTMVHSVDSLKLLRVLDELAAELPTPPNVCLQVNASEEATKHGWSADGILAEADAIAACRRIPVVGLMTMAAPGPDAESARPSFVRLRACRDALRARTGLSLPELSMGMSGDYEVAIEEGATLVRVGSALFEGVES